MSLFDKAASAAATSLKSLLPKVKEQTEVIRSTLADLRRKRAKLEAEKAALSNIPLLKSDYMAMVHAEIDAHAESFARDVARKIEREQSPPKTRGESTYTFANARLSKALTHRPEDGYLFGRLVGSFDFKFDRMSFLFRDAMKDALTRSFDLAKWEWEGETPQPLAKLRTEHERLTAAIAELQRQENELIEQAEEIGIVIG